MAAAHQVRHISKVNEVSKGLQSDKPLFRQMGQYKGSSIWTRDRYLSSGSLTHIVSEKEPVVEEGH